MIEPRWYDPFLTPDERILWEGQPAENPPVFQKEDAKNLLFLPFLGMGGFMLYTVSTSDPPGWVLWSFGSLIGVWLLFVLLSSLAPLLYRLWLVPGLAYVVTDRRILRYRRGVVDALDVARLPKGRIIPTKDGCGTITFEMEKRPTVHVSGAGFRVTMTTPQEWLTGMLRTSLATLDSFELFHIAEAEQVLALIRSVETAIPAVRPLMETPLLPLEEGEKLLWQGRPETPPIGFDYDWLSIMPGLFLMGAGLAAVGAMTFLPRQTADSPLVLQLLFSIPIFVGLYLLIGRSLLERFQMRRTVIVITDRRILRAVGGRVKAFIPGETIRLGLFQGQHGCGTVLLGDVWAAMSALTLHGHRGGFRLTSEKGFQLRYIPDAARAMDAINALRKGLTE